MRDYGNCEKTLRALGLCAKAGKLVIGTPLICEALKSNTKKPFLVLSSCDNGENTAKRLRDRCNYYGVPLVQLDADGETLSAAIGKNARVAAVAVTDENLCRLVKGTITSAE
jgi:ribosomal protein L7Ae-like RNA K-turn-binding protein